MQKAKSTNTILTKFIQEFILQFEIEGESDALPLRIHIDYRLYEILNRVLNGYRPNKKDNSNYVSFIVAINKLINQNNNVAPLEIDEVNIGKNSDYELVKDAFGEYKFRVL
jgi:DNA phosphorothioation-dependent restriction protein DptF